MRKLLIVIDMQNDFVDGSLGTLEAQNIVPKVLEKIRGCREKGMDILFTRDTHGMDYLRTAEGIKLPVEHCIKGTLGWEIVDALKHEAKEIRDKGTFGSKELGEYAAEQAYQEIELAGVCTDICVVTNALILKTYLPEAKIVVDKNCCAGVTPKTHEAALETMKMCQIEIGGE